MPPSDALPPPFFILDNGLNPEIARALTHLEFPIKSVQDEFNVSPGDSVEDSQIIDHIADYYGFRGVWITKDISSKRVHLEQIKLRRISVVWIRKQNLSTRQQLRIVAHGIADVFQTLTEASGPIHYVVLFHGTLNRERITYKRDWTG